MNSISVIIPAFNSASFLPRCLDSILNQSVCDYEIILVDDGSTDSTLTICNHYAKCNQNVRVFHIPNSGVSNARNYGISKAVFDWICFIDSDDWVEKDYLASFFVKEYESYDIILQGCINEKDGSEKGRKKLLNRSYRRDDLATFFIDNNILDFGSSCTKLFRRSIISQNGIKFPLHYQYGEDEVFVLNYLSHCKSVQCLDVEKYHYVEHSQSSLSRKNHDSISLFSFIKDSTEALQKMMNVQNGERVMARHLDKCTFFAKRAICNMYILNYSHSQKVKALCFFKSYVRNLLSHPGKVKNPFLIITGLGIFFQLEIFDFCAAIGIIKH